MPSICLFKLARLLFNLTSYRKLDQSIWCTNNHIRYSDNHIGLFMNTVIKIYKIIFTDLLFSIYSL
jgi:hypothetical protein